DIAPEQLPDAFADFFITRVQMIREELDSATPTPSSPFSEDVSQTESFDSFLPVTEDEKYTNTPPSLATLETLPCCLGTVKVIMVFLFHWTMLVTSVTWNAVVLSQKIELHSLSFDNSETLCNNGLLASIDAFSFNCTIDLEGSGQNSTFLYIETTKEHSNESQRLLSLHLPFDCTASSESTKSYCTQTAQNTYNIMMKLKALAMFSNAKIRGYLGASNGDTLYSNVIEMTAVYDQTDVIGKIKVNKKNMSNEDLFNTTIDVKELTLEFDCVSRAIPCAILMQINSSTVINKRENHVVYRGTFNGGDKINVTIKYAACSLNGRYNSLNFIIKSEFIISSTNGENIAIIVASIGSVILIILLLIGTLVKRFNLLSCQKCNPKTEKNNADEALQPLNSGEPVLSK
ncbi:unnamed protein product, partial [Lymnaea stagnalis]